jgi:hypothetical protein
MEPGEAVHRIVFRRGWAPDAHGIWTMGKRERRNLDGGRAPKWCRGWAWFIGADKPQESEVLRPSALPLLARCGQRTLNLIDPVAIGLVEGIKIHGPLQRR